MPYFRGIQVSVIASDRGTSLPEYPHPDASSVRLMRVGNAVDDLRDRGCQSPRPSASSSTCSDTDPTHQKKVNPRISVYIPSTPGEQFWLRYHINQSPPPSRYVFFKMFMNGHHIVSWGIDTDSRSAGIVTRALYGLGDEWKDVVGRVEAGSIGIETRYFHFMLGLDKKSVAEDGGSIEIRVFRCKGRKRIVANLDEYRNQERYGIASPSGGIVDNPQDATYYDYHLVDARDSPYATFCFHYRTMKNLEQLNLIPQPEPGFRPIAMTLRDPPISHHQGSPGRIHTSPTTRQFAFGVESLDTRVFDNDIKSAKMPLSEPLVSPKMEEYFLRSPPKLSSPNSARKTVVEPRKPPREEITAEILQRPLPELPKPHSRQSSRSSLRSNCPSLTPSLRKYVESDDFEKEEIRLSTAKPLLIPSESMQALELSNGGRGSGGEEEGNSLSDYAASPSSTEESQSPELPSPDGYVPTTGSVLERHLNQFDSPVAQSSPARGRTRVQIPRSESMLIREKDHTQDGTLRLTEAEWLRRTPSPLRGRSKPADRLWSPRPERRSSNSLSEVRVVGEGDHPDNLPGSRVGYTDEVPEGNWI